MYLLGPTHCSAAARQPLQPPRTCDLPQRDGPAVVAHSHEASITGQGQAAQHRVAGLHAEEAVTAPEVPEGG